MSTQALGVENRVTFLKDEVLRRGDKGPLVLDLQKQLLNAGYTLVSDGDYGPTTEARVRAFQSANGLIADGIAGPKTQATLSKRQVASKFLSQNDIAQAAAKLEIDISSMMAVNEIESKGTGFLPSGKPVILYERHIMYRELRDYGIDPKREMQKNPGLVNTARGGYLGGEREWSRLENAMRISREAAYEACSWGAFQIMGFHWELLGFDSIDDYVKYNHESERNHLDCFVRFVLSQRTMHNALKAKDWATFARLYNGSAYRENQYDTRLHLAEQRYQGLMKDVLVA